MLAQTLENIKQRNPLVDCITNFVTVETMANALLAIGASPVMADAYEEITDFIDISQALLCNMGTMAGEALRSMSRGGQYANKRGIPVVLDPVGLGASRLRNITADRLLREVHFAAIRGNISEIGKLAGSTSGARGVDAVASDICSLNELADMAQNLAQKYHTVIAISGPIDVVADADKRYAIYGGDPIMARITGSGCISGAILAAFLGANPENHLQAALGSCSFMKVVGEIAAENSQGRGTGSFHLALLDALYTLKPETLDARAKVEEIA